MRMKLKLRYPLATFSGTVLLALAGSFGARAQQPRKQPAAPEPYATIDRRMELVPDSSTHSAAGLARYITATFAAEADRARAAFSWVARHISYDRGNMYVLEFEREPAVVVQETLDKRRGVCRHYAELYATLTRLVGLKSYVVPGYASLRDPVGHAWCATRIDGQWYLMDPTWALERRLVNGKPLVVMRNDYYRMKPAAAIESHMPFDPLWQLLNAPRTPMQFQMGTVPPPPARPFHYPDSVAAYEQQNELQRLRATNRRVQQNGVSSGLIFNYFSKNQVKEHNYFIRLDNQQQATFNQCVYRFNAGIDKLNQFIDYYNHQFLPRKSDDELRQMLAAVAADFAQARALQAGVQFRSADLAALQQQQQQLAQQADTKLQGCQVFMDRYLRTGKLLRPTLFHPLSGTNEIVN
jgi:Transglutaminase-like superfamily